MNAHQRKRARLIEGPVGPTLAKLALPMVLGLIAVMSTPIVDAYFIGQLGTRELAAIAYITPIAIVISSVTLGLTVGTSTVLARQIGAEEWDKVRRTVSHAIILGLVTICSLLALGAMFINPILAAQSVPHAFYGEIKGFMAIWMLAMLPLVPAMVANGALRAHGDSMAASLVMSISAVVNLFMDPLLIFGLGPIPALGFNGAAWATVAANSASALFAAYFLIKRDKLIEWAWPRWTELSANWLAVLMIGAPSAMANIINPVSRGVLNRVVTDFGPASVAGFGVAFHIEMMSLIVPLALSAVIGPFIGQNMGAGRDDRMREALRVGIIFCFAYGALMAVILALSGEWIARQFRDDAETVAVISDYLLVVPWTYGFYTVIMIVGATFNAMGNPRPNFALYAVKFIGVYIPFAWLGATLFDMMGVYAAASLSNIVAGGIALILCRNRFAKPVLNPA